MNLEEAIKTAIDFENKVHTTYKDALQKATDPVGKRVFEVLAKEEAGHLAYLESRLDEWGKAGKLTDAHLDTAIPSKEKIEEGLACLKESMDQKEEPRALEVDLLEKALQAEKETAAFYRRMVDELDETGRNLFARFVEIEEGHLAIVQAQIDAVTGMGFWFDTAEFRLEAG